jgi:hypothetical protein
LSDTAFAQAWAEGEALSLEQATDLALAALAAVARAHPVAAHATLGVVTPADNFSRASVLQHPSETA